VQLAAFFAPINVSKSAFGKHQPNRKANQPIANLLPTFCFQESVMKRKSQILTYIIAAFFAAIATNSPAPVDADIVEIEATQVGGFYEVGIPDNSPTFQNYFVGHGTIGSFTTPERRSFFIFDIPELGPGEKLTGATFSLYLPTEFSVPANFFGGAEVFVVTSTAFSADTILDPMSAGVAPEEIFATFGMETFFGDLPIFLDDPPMGTFPLEMTIPLSPAAIAAIEASAGGKFVISGRMATYDPEPGALDEIMFSLSDLVVGGMDTPLPKPFLSFSTVPEPNTAMLVSALMIVFIKRKRAR
jgi:hypothetical protein